MSDMAYKDASLTIRLSPETLERLDQAAEKSKRTRSDYARLALEAQIDKTLAGS